MIESAITKGYFHRYEDGRTALRFRSAKGEWVSPTDSIHPRWLPLFDESFINSKSETRKFEGFSKWVIPR